MIKYLFPLIIILTVGNGCQSETERSNVEIPPSHQQFTEILQRYVKGNLVNYKGLKQDSTELIEYLNLLNNNAPDKYTWSINQQLAYWINAYNALTLKLVIDNYPIESITDLHPTLYVPLLNTVWHNKIFEIGGVMISLDEIEHDILRKEFNEPRIHFAINCASLSCPPLRAEAFIPNLLDQQLEEQAINFIDDNNFNIISKNNIEISKIFSWFKKDFTKKGSLIHFLNQYSVIPIQETANIEFTDYNWKLNDYK
jgi:hypothetical protein